LHFTELAEPARRFPVFVRGQGVHVFDDEGRRYFDALASLYAVNVGHGRGEIADAMAEQARTLAYFPIWGQLTEPAVMLADRITELAPAGMSRVFFTSGGSESVDAAWKLARQYHRLRGRASKTKILARRGAYHGTSLGALSVTGIVSLREAFEPLVPGALHGPTVDSFHAEESPREHALACAAAMERIVVSEGPETVGAIIVEPVQNAGGCLVADPAYFAALRDICNRHDLLLISDETICSWGRLGAWFGCQAFNYAPDMITTSKALTSGYAPMGAVVAGEAVVEPFLDRGVRFDHGLTFGGHPVAAAAALANIDILEREDLCVRAINTGGLFRAALETLYELPIVGDVRGHAMFQAVELVADTRTSAPFTSEQINLLTELIPARLFERGVICRAMHRGAPVLQFAPPLIADPDELSAVVHVVRDVLVEAMEAVL
jgi:adenosylmethionine-8-amino-7-oxononanoate aminotransferase